MVSVKVTLTISCVFLSVFDTSLGQDESNLVQLTTGPVRGWRMQSGASSGTYMYAYKGIPFAEPPTGKRRFMAPVAIRRWTEEKNLSLTDAPDCPHNQPPWFPDAVISEDCLTINVYTPETAQSLPVMVWIYGGALEGGSSSYANFAPDYLVEQGVIFVSFNYRVGALGFLNLITKQVPGNAGLQDQHLALKWVKREIGNFGGDKNQVTLFGQSSGSTCVSFHYISPKSQEADLQLPSKKHKKHKHKKHKKKKSDNDETASTSDTKSTVAKVVVKTTNEEEIDTKSITPTLQKSTPQPGSSPKGSSKKKKKGKESGTSSEEERWLDAIESGKLEEVDDELKKIKPKDPKLMTARQRAMLERKENIEKEPGCEQLLALPSGYREKVMTPEMALKAALKSQRRKQQADEKREKDKKKTMERLLRKQESKAGKLSSRGRGTRRQIPLVTYVNTPTGIYISFPPGIELPLTPKVAASQPPVKMCSIQGCNNRKKYSCSKTGASLCSLQCYQKNLSVT